MLHGLRDKRRKKHAQFIRSAEGETVKEKNKSTKRLRFMFFFSPHCVAAEQENSLYKVEGVFKKDLMAAALFR